MVTGTTGANFTPINAASRAESPSGVPQTLANDLIGPHHLIVLVSEHVTAPDVAEFFSGLGHDSRGQVKAAITLLT